jgi:hypothetical protein
MRRSIPIIAFVLMLFVVLPCWGEEKPREIWFHSLTSSDIEEDSAISGKCTGDTSSDEIECKFWKMRVHLGLNPDELPAELEKLAKELDEIKKKYKSADDYAKSFCEDIDIKNKDLEKDIQKSKKEKKLTAFETSVVKEMVDFCKNSSYEKLWALMNKFIITQTKTCQVSFDIEPWIVKLEKIETNKWVGDTGPSGLCNNIYFCTLEHEPDYDNLWTYTQTRTYARKGCEDLKVGETIIWDWRSKTFEMNCQFIEYVSPNPKTKHLNSKIYNYP